MPFIVWTDKLSVGHQEIDNQHKHFVTLVNSLHDAMKSGGTSREMPDILKKVSDYVSFHFSFEEKVMSQYKYTDLAAHCKIHKSFTEEVKTLVDGYSEGKILISIQIMNTLRDWLITHIKSEDQKYAVYLKKPVAGI